MTMIDLTTRPRDIAVDRNAGELRITWGDEKVSRYPLQWLRTNCPCATCREERRQTAVEEAAFEMDELRLTSGPLPSIQIANAELVGNYAVRLEWTDGHATGIYAFADLHAATSGDDGDKLPPLLSE